MSPVEVWIKLAHLVFMALWIGTLFYLPRLLLSHSLQREHAGIEGDNEQRMIRIEEFVFFHIATPAGLLTIVFGMALLAYGIDGGWLPLKLILVSLLVLLHLYFGQIILSFRGGEVRHGRLFYHALTQIPWLLLVAIVYLALAKPV